MKAAAKGGTVGQCRAEAAHRRSSVHLEEHVDHRQREDVERASNAQWRLQGKETGHGLLSRILVTKGTNRESKRGQRRAGGQVSNGQFLKMYTPWSHGSRLPGHGGRCRCGRPRANLEKPTRAIAGLGLPITEHRSFSTDDATSKTR